MVAFRWKRLILKLTGFLYLERSTAVGVKASLCVCCTHWRYVCVRVCVSVRAWMSVRVCALILNLSFSFRFPKDIVTFSYKIDCEFVPNDSVNNTLYMYGKLCPQSFALFLVIFPYKGTSPISYIRCGKQMTHLQSPYIEGSDGLWFKRYLDVDKDNAPSLTSCDDRSSILIDSVITSK